MIACYKDAQAIPEICERLVKTFRKLDIGYEIVFVNDHSPDIPHGITTIIVLLLFFCGLQLFGMAVLGEYVGKIFEEAKSRPRFIRKSIMHAGQEYGDRARIREFLANKKG